MTKIQLAGAAMAVLMATSLGACKPPASAKPAVDTSKIGDAVKADVAQLVADFNAHDATKVAGHDAADVVQMAHGQPNTVGAAADLASNQKGFAGDQNPHVTVANPVVDVAVSGDMAVYRSTYVFTVTDPKTKKVVTENGNYVAGYKQQADGSWKIAWSVISDTGPAPAAPPPAKS
jgi:ketosteroid isomerase-like protein